MTTWINYAETGYDERDGLLGGRWMFDDERRCQVWVQIKAPKPVGRKACKCGAPIGKDATRCRPCNLAEVRALKPTNPLHLRACPKCDAKVGQTCRTKAGHPAKAHKDRLVARRCECGAPAEANCTMCNPCRIEVRRESLRAAAERYRDRQRSDAA